MIQNIILNTLLLCSVIWLFILLYISYGINNHIFGDRSTLITKIFDNNPEKFSEEEINYLLNQARQTSCTAFASVVVVCYWIYLSFYFSFIPFIAIIIGLTFIVFIEIISKLIEFKTIYLSKLLIFFILVGINIYLLI